MPNTYTTSIGVTLSRDAFVAHYVAALLAMRRALEPHGPEPRAEDALRLAESQWDELEISRP